MCRVLKPGGRLVIIDKNAEHAGRLETAPSRAVKPGVSY